MYLQKLYRTEKNMQQNSKGTKVLTTSGLRAYSNNCGLNVDLELRLFEYVNNSKSFGFIYVASR